MTLRGKLVALFAPLHLALIALAGIGLLLAPGWLTALALPAAVYLAPLAGYRVHAWLSPLRPGVSDMNAPRYSAWWGAHQFQRLFVAAPPLEALLRLVPGLFSLWLRLWGSRIGRGVYWTPTLDLLDRTHLEVGDGVVFGHRVTVSCHVVRPRGERATLYVAPVRIGDGAFVGAGAVLAPGAVLDPGVRLEAGRHVRPRRRVRAC